METDYYSTLEFIIKNLLENFVSNFGKNVSVNLSKNDKQIAKNNILNYINELRAQDIYDKNKNIQRIKQLKSMSSKEDYGIFDQLINKINQFKNVDDMEIEKEAYESYPSHSQNQKLMQVDKQLIKQKISEEYTNDMLGRALSKAENFVLRFGKGNKTMNNNKFEYYNRFDNGLTKDKAQLLKSLINALDTLQDYYEMDGDKKRFPKNLNKNQIIAYIMNLKNNCHKEDQGIFEDFITIIKGGHIDFESNFNLNCKVNPNILASSGVSSIKFANKQEKIWKEKAMQYGDYPCELVTNKNWELNNNMPNSLNNNNNFL